MLKLLALTNIIHTKTTFFIYQLQLVDSCATAGDPDLECVGTVIIQMSRYLLSIAGAVCLYFIVAGAFDYVGGWKIEMKQSGKNKINYAIGGLILVTLSWTIVNTIVNWLFKF